MWSPKSGWTGVLAAARYGFADIVRELIKYGCDRNAVKEVSGASVKQNSSATVSDVLLCCCDLWSLNGMTECILQGGVNALHLAAIGNHVEVVRALAGEFRLSVTHRDNVSCTVYVNISLMFCSVCRTIRPLYGMFYWADSGWNSQLFCARAGT